MGSGIHKRLLPIKPWGMPKTPYHPRKGKHLGLSEHPDTLRISIKEKLEGGDDKAYACYVLDEGVNTTTEVIKAYHLTVDTLSEVEAGTISFAFKVDNKWWFKLEDEALYPTVDFIVDIFDRSDADTLGSLWENPEGISIRSQKAYESGSTGGGLIDAEMGDLRGWESANYTGSSHFFLSTSDPSDGQTNIYAAYAEFYTPQYADPNVIYKAVMSQANHNIKITVNSGTPDTTGYYGEPNVGYGAFACVGVHINPNDFTRGTGLNIAVGHRPSLSIPALSASQSGYYGGTCPHGGTWDTAAALSAYSLEQGQFLYGRIQNKTGDGYRILYTPFPDIIDFEYSPNDPAELCDGLVHGGSSVSSCYHYKEYPDQAPGNYGLVSGTNVFYFEIRNGYASLWLNGSTIYTNELLYTVDAGMIGLRGDYDFLSIFQDDGIDMHIKEIKSWTADAPEPPSDESGHGTWTLDGGFNYTDKYHDADGTYDPEA